MGMPQGYKSILERMDSLPDVLNLHYQFCQEIYCESPEEYECILADTRKKMMEILVGNIDLGDYSDMEDNQENLYPFIDNLLDVG